MYQPELRPDQVKALYYIKLKLKRPMTRILQRAVDSFLEEVRHKEDMAIRHGLTLLDWMAYEGDMANGKASDGANQTAGLKDVNAPF